MRLERTHFARFTFVRPRIFRSTSAAPCCAASPSLTTSADAASRADGRDFIVRRLDDNRLRHGSRTAATRQVQSNRVAFASQRRRLLDPTTPCAAPARCSRRAHRRLASRPARRTSRPARARLPATSATMRFNLKNTPRPSDDVPLTTTACLGGRRLSFSVVVSPLEMPGVDRRRRVGHDLARREPAAGRPACRRTSGPFWSWSSFRFRVAMSLASCVAGRNRYTRKPAAAPLISTVSSSTSSSGTSRKRTETGSENSTSR